MIYIQDKNEKMKKELLSLALEIILPYRLTGPTGPTGNTGPTGITGTIITTNSMFANNTLGGPISVILGGTNIPLSNNQSLGNFTVNATNDIYTIPVTGRYYLTYQINTTTSLLAGTRILLNSSTPLPGSIFSPAISTSNYNNNLITNLIAGNTISLQIFGVLSIVNLVGGGSTGASLTIIRID
ncbi:BclA C-terminal domain-containing protein [Bacillus sp. FSL R7-0642]|uniref:BclA C-terminal domain-containing protein n=1 Tax=Bacillus sp. FSL R7-0642 TaxID=2921585 RepID=UPI0030FB58AF